MEKNNSDRLKKRLLTTTSAIVAATTVLSVSACSGETSSEVAPSTDMTSVTKNFTEELKYDNVGYRKIAEGTGDTTEELVQPLDGEIGRIALIYGGNDNSVTMTLQEGNQSVVELELYANGGSTVAVPDGLNADSVKVSDASPTTKWSVYVLAPEIAP